MPGARVAGTLKVLLPQLAFNESFVYCQSSFSFKDIGSLTVPHFLVAVLYPSASTLNHDPAPTSVFASDFRHVYDNWAVMVASDGLGCACSVSGLSMHLDCQVLPGSNGAKRRHGVSSSITSNIVRCDACDGVIVDWETSAGRCLIDTITLCQSNEHIRPM